MCKYSISAPGEIMYMYCMQSLSVHPIDSLNMLDKISNDQTDYSVTNMVTVITLKIVG